MIWATTITTLFTPFFLRAAAFIWIKSNRKDYSFLFVGRSTLSWLHLRFFGSYTSVTSRFYSNLSDKPSTIFYVFYLLQSYFLNKKPWKQRFVIAAKKSTPHFFAYNIRRERFGFLFVNLAAYGTSSKISIAMEALGKATDIEVNPPICLSFTIVLLAFAKLLSIH